MLRSVHEALIPESFPPPSPKKEIKRIRSNGSGEIEEHQRMVIAGKFFFFIANAIKEEKLFQYFFFR